MLNTKSLEKPFSKTAPSPSNGAASCRSASACTRTKRSPVMAVMRCSSTAAPTAATVTAAAAKRATRRRRGFRFAVSPGTSCPAAAVSSIPVTAFSSAVVVTDSPLVSAAGAGSAELPSAVVVTAFSSATVAAVSSATSPTATTGAGLLSSPGASCPAAVLSSVPVAAFSPATVATFSSATSPLASAAASASCGAPQLPQKRMPSFTSLPQCLHCPILRLLIFALHACSSCLGNSVTQKAPVSE